MDDPFKRLFEPPMKPEVSETLAMILQVQANLRADSQPLTEDQRQRLQICVFADYQSVLGEVVKSNYFTFVADPNSDEESNLIYSTTTLSFEVCETPEHRLFNWHGFWLDPTWLVKPVGWVPDREGFLLIPAKAYGPNGQTFVF